MAQGNRDKQGITEMVAGVHTDCGRLQYSTELAKRESVSSGPFRDELTVTSFGGKGLGAVYFALSVRKSLKSCQRTKAFREQKTQKLVYRELSPLIGGRATLPKQD